MLASEEYRADQDVHLHQQELRHVLDLLQALSDGVSVIPGRDSPWDDMDGVDPRTASDFVGAVDGRLVGTAQSDREVDLAPGNNPFGTGAGERHE